MISWRIYYGDGTTFDSTQGTPEEAPAHDVCAVVFDEDPNNVGRVVLHRYDWYYRKDGRWWGGDIHGLLDQFLHCGPITAVKQGRTMADGEYERVMAAATEDPDFLPKSASLWIESPHGSE